MYFLCCIYSIYLFFLFVSSSHLQHFHFQNTLSSQVLHNGLAPADQLTLGVVKVWGAGSVNIKEVTLTDATGVAHPLTPQHNLDTQVRRVFGWLDGCICTKLQVQVVFSLISENTAVLPKGF